MHYIINLSNWDTQESLIYFNTINKQVLVIVMLTSHEDIEEPREQYVGLQYLVRAHLRY